MPVNVKISLQVAGASTTVTVESGGDLVENDSTAHIDIDRQLFNEVPLESASSSVSSLVTQTSPGVAADSNGLFHGLGDHAENSFSVDGQPITDQQSKVFSNQIPVDSIQSLEVIDGAPPAEYGDKTSLVIDVTTRSGQGVTTPHGSVTAAYGTFGTVNGGFDLAYGGQKWGNFISLDGLNSGRFLDPPEFVVMHDKGNEENSSTAWITSSLTADSLHLNLGFSRSWFQTPNSYDAQFASAWNGVIVRWHTCRLFERLRDRRMHANGWPHRSALADQNLQHRAHLEPPDQFEHRLHPRRFRAARPVQLLSQRRSLCGSRSPAIFKRKRSASFASSRMRAFAPASPT